MHRNVSSAASATILLSLAALDSASAAGGCGPGFHPNPYGRCVAVAPAPVVCTAGFRWHARLRRCVVL